MKQLFDGVYEKNGTLLTLNARPGQRAYTEKLVNVGNKEYREWIPSKSKLGAAIKNGLKTFPFTRASAVLYLGSSTGTTPSHISDIVTDGTVFCVEFAERVMREFLHLAEQRKNLVPILADARKPQDYAWVGSVDVVYEDVAQPDLVEIGIRNAERFLKDGGCLMVAIKSQSIDVTEKPGVTYKACERKLRDAGYKVVETIILEPYEKDHAMIVARK
ncbi:MAG: fibrillarin-like rRNA/tRNA 2'-O-methyltransferase [Candidatus Aenigmatarchaeota archaeon]|nr:MAG: fibrillarin-like rRNA/tRNA 2'-O-methyltransferase [Candidatus Aenigmarchaeota archaeon]